MSDQFTLAEIAEALGVHKTSVLRRADRESWTFSEEPFRGGSRRLYFLATLPRDVKKALAARALGISTDVSSTAGSISHPAVISPAGAASLPAPAAPFSEDLTQEQRARRNQRDAVLSEVERLEHEAGCSRKVAITTLLTNARTGRLAPHLVTMLSQARDRRGRKGGVDDGLPSPRSLERWLSVKASGGDLCPALPQKDMTVQPWHPLAVALRQRPQGGTLRWLHEQLQKEWNPAWGERAPSYDTVARFFREKFSQIDVLVGRHAGMDLQAHRRYTVRTRVGLMPAMEAHADGWCTHFTAPHPVSGEFVTYEVWTATDYACGYPAEPAFGLSESFEVIAKCLENYIRTFGVPLIFQTDSTGSVKNDRFEFDPVASLQERLGLTIAHPKMLDTGKGNSQANGLAENLHAFYDREARELATYQGKGMDSLALKRVKRLTAKMVKAKDAQERAALRREAERAGKGIVFDTYDEAVAWMKKTVDKRRDTPNRNLPKIDDPATGKRRHMTPRERLEQFRAEGWEPVMLSEAEIVDAFRPHVKKTVRRGGVSPFSGQRYDHPVLEHWNGKEVMVAIDIMDWRSVWVKDLQGRLICEAKYLEGRLPRPQSMYEAAFEKRERAQIRRRENQIDAIESRNPFDVIEAPAEPVIDMAMHLYGDIDTAPVTAELIAPPEPAPVTRQKAQPRHYDDITDIAMYLYGDQLEEEGEKSGEDPDFRKAVGQ